MLVPVFLPTTLESSEKILEAIEELKNKVPSHPVHSIEDTRSRAEKMPEQDGKTESIEHKSMS